MTAAADHGRASTFLATLLQGRPVPPLAKQAFGQIVLSEEREVVFGAEGFGDETGWRLMLVLFVASSASFEVAPDVLPMIGLAGDLRTAGLLAHLEQRQLIQADEQEVALTDAGRLKLQGLLCLL
jgi:hypothetical protein